MSIPERVDEMVPKAPLPAIGTPLESTRLFPKFRLGSPKFGWLRKLNDSNRN